MPNSPLANVPYPSGSDAPAAAADMMALVMATDPRLVLPAVDEADRDAKYADAPVSTMVVSGQSRKIWVKTGPSPTDWWTVYERQEWTTGFTALSGWEIDDAIAIRNTYTTEVRMKAIRTGDDITATSTGNITPDADVAVIPAQIADTLKLRQVITPFRASITSGGAAILVDGTIRIYDLHSGSSIRNSDGVWLSATWNN